MALYRKSLAALVVRTEQCLAHSKRSISIRGSYFCCQALFHLESLSFLVCLPNFIPCSKVIFFSFFLPWIHSHKNLLNILLITGFSFTLSLQIKTTFSAWILWLQWRMSIFIEWGLGFHHLCWTHFSIPCSVAHCFGLTFLRIRRGHWLCVAVKTGHCSAMCRGSAGHKDTSLRLLVWSCFHFCLTSCLLSCLEWKPPWPLLTFSLKVTSLLSSCYLLFPQSAFWSALPSQLQSLLRREHIHPKFYLSQLRSKRTHPS